MTQSRNIQNRQSGIYVIWTLILLPILIGVLAFSFDAGIAMANHQRARTAADAAAQAGAYAIMREPDLKGTDENLKKLALDRVVKTALLAAEHNGFKDGVDNVQVSVNYPPTSQQSEYYDGSTSTNYLGVTVTIPIFPYFARALPSLADSFYEDPGNKLITLNAYAVGKAGSSSSNTCPGIYIFGKADRVLALYHGSDFQVSNGGIFIDYYDITGTSYFGSNGSTMSAEWIEKNQNGMENGAIEPTCTSYPVDSPCPKPVSKNREMPEIPAQTTCVSSNTKVCIANGLKWSDCDKDTCISSKCKGVGTNLGSSPELQAAEYCEGLTIVNTGTSATPLKLKPSLSTNKFNLNGSNLTIIGSVAEGVAGYDYDGITLISYPKLPTDPKTNPARLEMGDTKEGARSTLRGDLRAYFNAIWLDNHASKDIPTLLAVKSFEEQGCGKLADPIAVVQ